MGDFFSSLFGGGAPSAPPIPDQPDAPKADSAELARQRALIEKARRGREALVRDPSTFVPQGGSGVNVPRPIL